jgi:type II secretory pathway pseudopilin PulG
MVIEPFDATDSAEGVSVIAVPVGASSGDHSHAPARATTATSTTERLTRPMTGKEEVMWNGKNNMGMGLARLRARTAAASDRSGLDEGGYLLAVLLIGMAVAAVWASVSLPAWRFQAQREKELELIFRGEQYARAIALYYMKNNRTLPSDVDQLVQGHYLRKKWKDPVTGKDFALVMSGGGQVPPAGSPSRGGPPAGGQPAAPNRGSGPGQQPPAQQGGGQTAGIAGVGSMSEAASIIVYQNVQQHSLWQFTLQAACQRYQFNCFGQQNQGPGGRPGDRSGGPGRGLDAPGGRPGGPGGPGRGGPGAPPGRGGGDAPVRGGLPGRGRG